MSEGPPPRRRDGFIYLREVVMRAKPAEGGGQKEVAAEPPRPWVYLREAR